MKWWRRWRARRAMARYIRARSGPQITRIRLIHGRPHDARMAWDHEP